MIPVHATITEQQAERLDRLRKKTGITLSELLRRLIDEHLTELEAKLLNRKP
jgi:predicted DNA-binding protein